MVMMREKAMKGSMLKIITAVLMAAFICLIAPAAEAQVPNVKPNIIFFISDDMGWGDSIVYNPESKVPMPNLDKLAAEGMWFTDAHTSAAVCAPTRYSAMTGNYQWRGLKPYGQWNYRGGSQILDDQWTIADILQDNGYNTAIFGKLHLGGDLYKKGSDEFVGALEPEDSIDFARGLQNGPLTYGFNYAYLCLRGIQDSPYAFFENDQLVGNPDELMMWEKGEYGGSRIPEDGIGMLYWNSSEVGPILTQKAIDFIDRHHQKNLDEGTDTPFFLYYASQSAHGPWTPPDSFHGEPVKGVSGLYNLADDLYETNNLMNDPSQAERIQILRERFLQLRSSDRTAPVYCNGKPVAPPGTDDIICGSDDGDGASGGGASGG
jgi:arylsulfatase A-like enzyme